MAQLATVVIRTLALCDILSLVTALPQGQWGFGIFGDSSGQSTYNDFQTGGCKDVIAIIARGSAEPGNVGVTTGPYLCSNLKQAYPNRFACEGIGPKEYSAAITDNMRPKGTSDSGITAGISLFTAVHEKCPNSVLLFEGYSQGAALMHNVIEGVSEDVRKQIIAGVLFGDTKFEQSKGAIPGLSGGKLKIFCIDDDPVCNGVLAVTAGHFAYLNNGDLRKSFDWLTAQADAALKAKGQRPSVPVPDKLPSADGDLDES